MRGYWVIGVLVLAACAGVSSNGPIAQSCNRSERNASTPQLCGCIQRVAAQTLNASDQQRAAKFFTNPDKAYDVKLSQSRADDAFWERYKSFAASAEASCSAS